MLEKERLKKKEKRNNVWRDILIIIVGVALLIGYGMAISRMEFFNTPLDIVLQFLMWLIWAAVITGAYALILFSEYCMQRNIEKIELNAKTDEFLKYLGDREIQVKLKNVTDFSFSLEKAILNPKITYYVRKKGPDIEIVLYKKNKEVGRWDNTDYNFFFDHYEPIYEAKKEKE